MEGNLVTPGTIEFIFDFASPNAYLAYRVLPDVLARTGASLVLRPALLGGIFKATGNRAPMLAFADVAGKLNYEALEMRRFVARHGLSRFRINPFFPVNSLALMRGLIAAGDALQAAYVEAVLVAMWEDGLPMADPETAAGVLRAAGLDAEDILGRAQGDAVKQALAAATQAAVARGVFGIPTFFVGEEMFFGKERLGQVETYLQTGVP
jgi:2-hydroxychromene-2-carboxylate isomerase